MLKHVKLAVFLFTIASTLVFFHISCVNYDKWQKTHDVAKACEDLYMQQCNADQKPKNVCIEQFKNRQVCKFNNKKELQSEFLP